MKKKIYYHDTDCGGVVYYGNYLKYLEEARTEYLEDRGIFIKDMIAAHGVMFVVARQEIDYKAPAFYGDVLVTDARVTDASGVKVWFEYEIKNQDGKLIARAKTLLVCVDKTFKPRSIPDDIKKKITR
ncbi:MAG: acyl-CoA thioesterase [Candidatus Omnitrophica bacterium]|nr:acyl-CoA thioesterase [Candidatus Omnitrophota bacterium]